MSDMKKVAPPLEKQSKGPARPYGVNGFFNEFSNIFQYKLQLPKKTEGHMMELVFFSNSMTTDSNCLVCLPPSPRS